MNDAATGRTGESEGIGHEPTVLRGRAVAVWALALAGLVVVALLVTRGVWRSLQSGQQREREAVVDGMSEPFLPAASEQSLDPDQRRTRLDYERRQQQLLSRYDWFDRREGFARIPIERAMELIVQREQRRGQREEREQEQTPSQGPNQ